MPEFPWCIPLVAAPTGHWSTSSASTTAPVAGWPRGHLSTAAIAGLPSLAAYESATSTEDRLAGFRDQAARHPGVTVTASFAEAYSFDAGRAEMQRLLAAGPLAEAWFCGDDVLSIGALSALADAGLKVPQDVGIIGFNDMEMARWANINLTTIRQPIAEIIAASIDLVVAAVEDEDLPRSCACSTVLSWNAAP